MRWLTYARSGPPRWDEVLAAYDAAWGALQDPTLRSDPEYQEGLQILEGYHAANSERGCNPIFQEHKFRIHLGPHTLEGALDRVDATDSGYEVIDYKLEREVRSQEQVDEDLQLGLYSVGMEEAHGIRPEALTLYFLRHNLRRTTERSSAQVRELKRWVIATGNDINSERSWEPCPGQQCGGCDFKSACPAHTGQPLPPLPVREPARSKPPELVLPGLLDTPVPAGQLALPWE